MVKQIGSFDGFLVYSSALMKGCHVTDVFFTSHCLMERNHSVNVLYDMLDSVLIPWTDAAIC